MSRSRKPRVTPPDKEASMHAPRLDVKNKEVALFFFFFSPYYALMCNELEKQILHDIPPW